MIFVIEDDPVLRRSLVEFLTLKGHPAVGHETAEEALAAARASPPDVALSDVQLPGMGGLELLEELGKMDAGMVRIAMTAHASVAAAVRAMRAGAYDYLEKPVDLERLLLLVTRATAHKSTQRELDWQRNGGRVDLADSLMGQSAAMKAVREQVALLSTLTGEAPPVLITGETGAGKGLVAKAIHRGRFGMDQPWIEVNCAALPLNLVEGELFGHEKSAFTDAKQAKVGLFEAANGGTIFLDEIGELSLEVQAKLLGVLESRMVRRLGAVRERPVSAAVLAATNMPLAQAIAAGRFRSDLFHRLAAFTIALPPLRERGDALPLAHAFLKDVANRYHKPLEGFSAAAVARIQSYSWPGNIRELRFALERAVLLSNPTETVVAAHHFAFPPQGGMAAGPGLPPAAAEIPLQVGPGGNVVVKLPPQGVPFAEIERAVLAAALEATGGNVVHAAKLLNLNRDALRYRIKKFGLAAAPDP